MIKVSYDNSLFNDIMWSLDKYAQYSQIFDNRIITNPFVKSNIGVPVLHYRDINSIKNTTSDVVIVDLLTEGYHSTAFFDQYPKNKSYILCSNGWWDPSVDLGFEYYLLYYNYFLYNYAHRMLDYRALDFFQSKEYNLTSEKKYLFCSFIGTAKPNRDQIVDQILNNVTTKDYVLNYNGTEFGQSSRDMDIKYDFSQYNSYHHIFDHYSISSSIPIEIYNKSRVNLVVETNQIDEYDEFHLTEKTVKSLITGIPFIIYSSYKFLDKLRAIGFKTYNELWSEEYDNNPLASSRIDDIIKLLNELNKFNWDDKTVINKLQEIANHNKLVLMNINSVMKPQLEKIIYDVTQFNL